MYLNDLQGVNCCGAAVEVMAFLCHVKQKQQCAGGDVGCDRSWIVFSPLSMGISQRNGPVRKFSPEHSTPVRVCMSVML